MYTQFNPNPSKPINRQIYLFLKEKILSGEIAPDSKMPSTQSLAKTFNTHVATVQDAMHALVKEGYLTRAPRRGTFVQPVKDKIRRVGLFYLGEPDHLKINYGAFHGKVLASLRQEFTRLKIEGIFITDHHAHADDPKGCPELKRRIARGEIDAVIAPNLYGAAVDWVGKLPVPTAIHSPSGKRHTITFDNQQFADLALGALKKQGCKTVGFVLPSEKTETHMPDSVGKLFDYFKESATQHGLQWKDSWIMGTKPGTILSSELAQEQFGFQAFTQLWKKKNLPDGLVVYPDTSCRGLMTAALFHGVNIPGQLKLALHRNKESPFLCPVETYFIESSADETGRALVDHIFEQTKGKCSGRQDFIPFHLRFHPAGKPL